MHRHAEQVDVRALAGGMELSIYCAAGGEVWHGSIIGGLTEAELKNAGVRRVVCNSREQLSRAWWGELHSSCSEEDVRAKGCAAIGHIIGQRLARATGPYTIPEQTMPGKARVRL